MKKFQDWLNENVEFDDNDPNSLYVKYHNKETGEKGHVLRGHQKSIANKMPVDNKEELSNFVSGKKPKNGDMAYSKYRGDVYVGMLALNHDNGPVMEVDREYAMNSCPHLVGAKGYRISGYLVFPPISGIKNPTNRPTLSVGYEGPIVWDAKKGMFYAQPDSD